MPARRVPLTPRPSALSRAVGETIRTRRTALGLSQETVGERANLGQAYLSTVENGRRNPSLEALEAIAGALDLPLSTLLLQAEARLLAERDAEPRL